MDWADMAINDMERRHERWEHKAPRCAHCGEILNLDKYQHEAGEDTYCEDCFEKMCLHDNALIEELVSNYVSEHREAV